MGFGLFYQVIEAERMASYCAWRSLNLLLGKNFCTERMFRLWHRLPREEIESTSLEVCKRHVDMALRDMV